VCRLGDHRDAAKLSNEKPSTWRSPARSVCGFLLGIAVLFVCGTARTQVLYVSQGVRNTRIVSTYNATTGALLSSSLIAGLKAPFGLAINSNSNPPVIFVADAGDNVIGEYNATDGSAINQAVIQYSKPFFLLLSGTTLYVARSGGTEVDTYATTGAKIKVPFISGIGRIGGLMVSGNVLYVSDQNAGKVDEYDASTGVLNTSFLVAGSFPNGLAVYGNDIFVAQLGPLGALLRGRISKCTLTGTLIDPNFITPGISVLYNLLLSGSTLYVVEEGSPGTIGEYNAATGVRTGGFITGRLFPFGLAISSLQK